MSSALTRSTAKEFFANERTFLHWLNIAVTVGSLAAAMLGISGHAHYHWGDDYQRRAVAARVLALLVMFTSICIAIYAALLYVWRAVALKERLTHGYSNTILPITVTIVMTFVLLSVFAGAVQSYERSKGAGQHEIPRTAMHDVQSLLVHESSSIHTLAM